MSANDVTNNVMFSSLKQNLLLIKIFREEKYDKLWRKINFYQR